MAGRNLSGRPMPERAVVNIIVTSLFAQLGHAMDEIVSLAERLGKAETFKNALLAENEALKQENAKMKTPVTTDQ